MSTEGLLWIMIGSLLVTCFASIGARALRHFSRHDLEDICARRKALDRFGEILRLHDYVGQGVETLALATSTLLVLSSGFWTLLTASSGDHPAIPADQPWLLFGMLVLCLSLVLSFAKLWIPWSITRLWGTGFVYHTWRMWRVLCFLIAPWIFTARIVDAFFHRVAGRQREEPNGETFEDEIRSIVTEGHREGLLEEDAREMIEGVIDLGEAEVSEIMTPRTEMHTLHVGLPWKEMLQYVIQEGHTRIPVFDKSRDDIIGILYSKDLLPELANDVKHEGRPLQEFLRPAYFVPETKAVDDLLEEFQKNRTHMAVVLDEYGGVSGLVTIEDVLEEIVGEIIDEYDEELVEEIRNIDPYTCEALGRVHIDEINEHLGLELPEDKDFDTIAGFVFHELGRVPAVGEVLNYNETARLTVLEATPRRIERLRIEVVREAERETA